MLSQGLLSESNCYNYFAENGFIVFGTFMEGSPFDFVIYRKDIGIKRVEIKSSVCIKNGSYRVSLKGGPIYTNRKGTSSIKRTFKKEDSDILCVFLPKENKYVFFLSETIKVSNVLTINIDKLSKGFYIESIGELFQAALDPVLKTGGTPKTCLQIDTSSSPPLFRKQ